MREIRAIYATMEARSDGRKYKVDCGIGRALIVYPGVYAPRIFTDSLWFGGEVSSLVKKASMLEIGTGTGIIAIMCAMGGARVVATDIDRDATQNAVANARRFGLERHIRVRTGPMYECVPAHLRFKYVFWAHPFNNSRWRRPRGKLYKTGIDYRYRGLESYMRGVRQHLLPGGRALLGTGDSADVVGIVASAIRNRMEVRVLRKYRLPLQEGGKSKVTYLLCELVPWERRRRKGVSNDADVGGS
jgi:tRNA1(Val) A37 N6-methylase TrmN6